jgi:hypothetical protein
MSTPFAPLKFIVCLSVCLPSCSSVCSYLSICLPVSVCSSVYKSSSVCSSVCSICSFIFVYLSASIICLFYLPIPLISSLLPDRFSIIYTLLRVGVTFFHIALVLLSELASHRTYSITSPVPAFIPCSISLNAVSEPSSACPAKDEVVHESSQCQIVPKSSHLPSFPANHCYPDAMPASPQPGRV